MLKLNFLIKHFIELLFFNLLSELVLINLGCYHVPLYHFAGSADNRAVGHAQRIVDASILLGYNISRNSYSSL